MNELGMQFVNSIIPALLVFVIGAIFLYGTKGLGLLANNNQVMTAVSTIANDENLRAIARNLCIYAQKYVSTVAIEKLKYVVDQIKAYCKQSGITITESQVLEIVQSTFDKYEKEIKENAFIQNLEKIFKEKDNGALIAG